MQSREIIERLVQHLEDGPDDTSNIIKELGITRKELLALRSSSLVTVRLEKTNGGMTNLWRLARVQVA